MLYFPQPRRGSGATIRLGQVVVTVSEVAGAEAVIYFGGNAEDVSLSLDTFREAFPGRAFYLPHYRGYGGSGGSPSEQGLVADALALFDFVRARHARVVLVGRSLGSGLAVRVASQRAVSRLVLVTPYDSITGVAAWHFPWVPVRWLLRDRYESWRYAPLVNVPTWIIAAEHDEVIPRVSTELLRTRFRPGIATYTVIPGTGHNTISDTAAYWHELVSFVL
jgi:hypothetical protein